MSRGAITKSDGYEQTCPKLGIQLCTEVAQDDYNIHARLGKLAQTVGFLLEQDLG